MFEAETIKSIVKEALKDRNVFLVDMLITQAGKISVYIDRFEGGVTIDDCASVSRFIESKLDREEEDFELEVSSPGEARSLLLPVQYQKHIGKEVTVLKQDGVRIQGLLKDVKELGVVIQTEKVIKDKQSGKKKKESRIVEIEHKEIKSARIIVIK